MKEQVNAVSPVEVSAEDAPRADGADQDGLEGGSDGYSATSVAESEQEKGVFDLGDEAEAQEAEARGDVHAEFEEETMRLGQRTPAKPSAEEVRQHCISHIPYRSWCKHCVRGRGRTAMHQRRPDDAEAQSRRRPTVHLDYFYLGARSEETLPILAVLDEQSGRTFSIPMPCKGVGHQYCSAVLVKMLRLLGLQNGILKTDGERALVALRTAVQEKLVDMGHEDAAKGESASNGAIESTVGRLQGVARTLKSSLTERYGEVGPRHPILCWMINYAGSLLSRFLRGEDGRTGYERSTGKSWRVQLPEFGECVLFQPLKGERDTKKVEPRFESGIFLGIQEGTAMRWIGTADGVVRTWTIKRVPDDEKWQRSLLDQMVGLPWQLRPTSSKSLESEAPAVEIELAEEKPEDVLPAAEPKRRNYIPRGIYVRRDVELKQFGYTDGCDGCERARAGLSHRAHSQACKQRIMEELSKTEAGKKKVDKVRRKEEEYLVAYQDREEKRKAGEQQGDGSKKQKSAEKEFEEMDQILSEAGGIGQGGRDEPAASGAAEAPAVLDDAGEAAGAGGGVMDVESHGNDVQVSMDIGVLHRLKCDADFEEKVREASLMETSQLMMDEEVETRRLLLQIGAVSLEQAYDFKQPSIVELFSPPRVTGYGGGKQLSNGVALDLTTTDAEGRPWNFCDPDCRDRADKLVESLDPDLLIGSPPCGPFSALQALNVGKANAEVMQAKLDDAREHLEYCCQQYEKRIHAGRYFLHEHPHLAGSWDEECIKRLENHPDVLRVTGDMCEQGMTVKDDDGLEGFAKKRTGYLTNSPYIAAELEVLCSNEPGAVQIWRETCYEPKKGQLPGRKGPHWSSVVRRVTLDVTNGRVLQDLHDACNAEKSLVKFTIPDGCVRVETLFYYKVEGKRWHRHIPLIGGKAKQCEVYPPGLIRSILRGLRKQLRKDVPISSLDFGPTNQEQDVDFSLVSEDWSTFSDEISGKALETTMVQAARAEEIDFANRYGVWTPVPIQQAWDRTGRGPISSRWIDVNKGDEKRPQYRSRLVIQEVRQSNVEAIFAATPPLESVRMLLSMQRSGFEVDHEGRVRKVMFIDIRRAHWAARIFREVYVALPTEAGLPEGMCGLLQKAMYGCRDAAACWELEISDFFLHAMVLHLVWAALYFL